MPRTKAPPETAVLLDALRSNLSLLGELAARYEVNLAPRAGAASRPAVGSPDRVHALVGAEMEALAQEQLRVLLLDTRTRLMGVRVIYQGTVNASAVRAAEVLRPAVVEAAPSIILVHNHPSGDPEPSPDDAKVTRDLAQAARLLGIALLDHVVVGGGRFVSLKEREAL